MDKNQILNRIEKINAGVDALATAQKIPVGSEREVFLLLLNKALEGETFSDVFDA